MLRGSLRGLVGFSFLRCGVPHTHPKDALADKGSVEGTPYAGGYFRVKFKFTDEFPAAPPKCTFPPPPPPSLSSCVPLNVDFCVCV